jgi:cation:H+ antiporter
MVLAVVLLLVSAAVIYFACEWFVNAVEWLGARLSLGTVAVGSVLAAVGTALPESVVTLVAVAFGGGDERKNIGIGAAMGGPLVLSTIAYGVVGVTLLLVHRRFAARPAGTSSLVGDQIWFLVVFVVKVTLGLLVFAWKPWLAWLFVIAYAIYVWREIRSANAGGAHSTDDLEPLRLTRSRSAPPAWAIVVQTVVTLAVIFGASQLFVVQLENLGPHLGLASGTVALLLAPIATELPETLNAIIWVRQGKSDLALANVSGSMMIQATIPSALGIGFTSWHFDDPMILAGLATVASILLMIVLGRLRWLRAGTLLLPILLYGAFLAGLVAIG